MSGASESQGGSVIPNGQPPQWNYSGKLRPQHNSSITSNGTPTPPTNSYAGSLSSQSSRDPSPIPASCLLSHTAGSLSRSSPDVRQPPLSQDNIPLVRESPNQSSSQYIVNGPQVTSVQRTGAQTSHQGSVPPSSHSSSTSASSYSNPDLSPGRVPSSEPDGQANVGMSHSSTSAYSHLDSATRLPPAGGPSYRPIDSDSSYIGPPANMDSSNITGPPTSTGASSLSGPPQTGPLTSMETSNLSRPPQTGPLTSMETSNLSRPPQMGPPTNTGTSNFSGPPTSVGASNLSGPPQMGPPTSMGTSTLSGPPQMGPPTSMGTSNLSGPPQMGPPTSVGASNLSGPPQMGPPTSMGTSNLSGPPQMGPPTSMGTTNLPGPPQMGPAGMGTSNLSGPPTSVGASNVSGPPQIGPPGRGTSNLSGLPTSVGTSNLSRAPQMGPPASMGTSNLSGPATSVRASTFSGPSANVGTSNLSGPPTTVAGTFSFSEPQKMGPPMKLGASNLSHSGPPSTGASNLSGPPHMGPPTSTGASNLSGPPHIGLGASMGASNLSGPPHMGPPTSTGASNLSGPPHNGPATSTGASNLPGPPHIGLGASMGASNLSGPPHMGPPTSTGASNLPGPPHIGLGASMGASNISGPPHMGLPTNMGGSNFSGPPQMGIPVSLGAKDLSGAPPLQPPTRIGASNFSGPPQLRPPASIGASNLSAPPQMVPPVIAGMSNPSGPQQMGPSTSMGGSNLYAPPQMGLPTTIGGINPPRLPLGPSTSMSSSNLSATSQMGHPTSMGGPNLSKPALLGPTTGMAAPNLIGPSLVPTTSTGGLSLSGPPTSMGASNLPGPPQMGTTTSMGASNLSGPPQTGAPTSMGASNLSGPPQTGAPTSMGITNFSGPPQMSPPTSMGTSSLSGPPVGPTSMGSSNFSGPHQMGPPMPNRMGPQQMGPPTSMGGHSSFGPRAGVAVPQMRPPTSMGSSSFAGPPTGPPPVGLPRSMAPSYASAVMDPQRNMAGPPPPPPGLDRNVGATLPPQGYMASRQGGMPPTRPSQYPGAPTQPSSVAQDHRQNYQQFGAATDTLSSQFSNMSVARTGFNKLWGMDSVDLLQCRNVLPAEKVQPPKIRLHQEFLDSVNCSPEIFRCTLTKIPENNSLLQKSRLPLGILIHPFKDLNHLPVIQCSTIVRCRSCRTYINPFVYFVDHKRWKCNLCFRVNELPEEFQYDPVSKTYGDPTRRPEIKSSTIEFIAPSEYMLRPPQPAVYLFLLDVSRLGVECGYLNLFCDTLLEELDKLPGDGRTQIGFITYDSSVHFYNLAEGLSQPQQMIVVDTDEVFLPCPDNLLVNLAESRELVMDLLKKIPTMFLNSHDTKSSLGPALQAAYKLMAPTGGRVTVFQSCLPNHGPGALVAREDPSQRAGKDAPHLNPVTDFYKRLALDCSGQQIAVDLFIINSQYCDIATISGISRFSGGCIHHFPLFKASNAVLADSLERCLRRYLTRKIGFEAVMRIRCSRGLAIHTFHGNFFVRSTDLLSLPNVNPDAGFGMQVSVEESLSDIQNICFQAALLYTSSKGERRIRVHTLCLPVAATLSDILYSADQQCIVGLLAKMAVDRSLQSSLSDARDAFINVAIDVLSVYKLVENSGNSAGLLAPMNLRLLPLYILALLKYVAFRTGQSTRLDDRLFAMCQMKTLPLSTLIQAIYPDLYPVHCLDDQNCEQLDVDGTLVPQPPRLHLSAEKLDSHGAFLMDAGEHMMMHVGHGISNEFCSSVLGVPAFSHIPEEMYELPEIESPESERLRNFVNYLQSEKPYPTMLQVIRDDSNLRGKFIERLVEDRSEAALSYYEFLQHLKANIK